MFYSEYFEKDVAITEEEKEILLDIYEEIAEEQVFRRTTKTASQLIFPTTTSLFDTVLYHVEHFGSDMSGYDDIEHLLNQTEFSFACHYF